MGGPHPLVTALPSPPHTHPPALHLPMQAARRVDKVEVNYSRAAKQVDVRSLKELMWHGVHSVAAEPPTGDDDGAAQQQQQQQVLQFQDVLGTVPGRNPAGRLEDLSGEQRAAVCAYACSGGRPPCCAASGPPRAASQPPPPTPPLPPPLFSNCNRLLPPHSHPFLRAVHLCFICVLHLANEHGLVINGVPELDQLHISNVPHAAAAEAEAAH